MPKLTPAQDKALLSRITWGYRVRRGRQGRRPNYGEINPHCWSDAHDALLSGTYKPRHLDYYIRGSSFAQAEVGGKRQGLRD